MPSLPTTISPPSLQQLLSPLLASLPTAAVGPSPPAALLPLLSPILRQRVQYLSAASSDPWLPLLTYDSSASSKLTQLVSSDRLEPHPVSGEVEWDWEAETETQVRYRRVDEETLQAIVVLRELGLGARCVWCVGDQEGGGDGWRIGEVIVLDAKSHSETESGQPSIAEAEEAFRNEKEKSKKDGYLIVHNGVPAEAVEEEDDDDDYWAQYDNTPARTPGPHEEPASAPPRTHARDDDSYYSRYASVQPAMDNHDPDEEVPEGIESSLGQDEIRRELDSHPELTTTTSTWETVHGDAELAHPRPASSSSGEDTVARLEREAEKREERSDSGSSREETGVKQHIGTSIKSLYRLAKVTGIERLEFERLVRTELECLVFMDEDE